MFENEKIIKLPEEEFRLLRDLIKDYCGIYFDDSSRFLLEKRLSRRIEAHHLDNFRDYYRLLLYGRNRGEELAAVMDNLTVNETYFFREQAQLKAFSDELLEEFTGLRKDRKLRIWSAGCSSGEEPYTLAMLAMEKGLPEKGWDVVIVASDINQRVLQTARKGVYRKNSFRTTEDYYIKKYFEAEGDGLYRIKDSVRRFVDFSCINLMDPLKVRFVGTVDIIFCRNVLIYFDPESRKKVIENFYTRLSDLGYLMLGHAESLINISTAFTLKHLKNDIGYQKPDGKGATARPPAGFMWSDK
ncbi:MAG: protein-glutamate O-methyltransferase CheR [Nitrospiraceae bacterium]|nr:protein-glutamate O-methyltransferase CheR [Nitrospiraceae bacterium]